MSTQENKQRQKFLNVRILITGVITVFILGLLSWQHLHGKVPSHHILNQEELPAISNWWGGLLLPVLTWFLLTRIQNRLVQQESSTQSFQNQISRIISLFVLGLFFGLTLAISFTNDYKPFLDNVLYILLAISFIIPLFYSEFILGFILGMTYTFGAILPTAFILVMAAVGFLIYRFIRPLFIRLINVFTK